MDIYTAHRRLFGRDFIFRKQKESTLFCKFILSRCPRIIHIRHLIDAVILAQWRLPID